MKESVSQPSDFAVTNGGGIRQSIEKGPITLADITAVLPFGNSISQIKVTGAQVKEMFELSLCSPAPKNAEGNILLDNAKQPQLGANGGFLHVSSTIHVYYDSTKQGTLLSEDDGNTTGQTLVSSRVLRIDIQNKETGKFEPINEAATYYMTTNDFLAAGGDSYDMLGVQREEGPSLDSVLINYLKKATTLDTTKKTNTISLSQYENPFPEERILSMSEAAFNQKFNTGKKPIPEPKPKRTQKPGAILIQIKKKMFNRCQQQDYLKKHRTAHNDFQKLVKGPKLHHIRSITFVHHLFASKT